MKLRQYRNSAAQEEGGQDAAWMEAAWLQPVVMNRQEMSAAGLDLRERVALSETESGECWIGEQAGRIMACGAFRFLNSVLGEIVLLGVDPDSRRHGFGSRMLAFLEERILSLGGRAAKLDIPAGDVGTRAFFEHAGYTMHVRTIGQEETECLYGKMLVELPERTEEENRRFEADWEVSQRVTALARGLLEQGLSPEEARSSLLASEAYAEWKGIERSLMVNYEDPEMYRDLEASVHSDRRIGAINRRAEEWFRQMVESEAADPVATEGEAPEPEPIFAQFGMEIDPEQLAWEIARFSHQTGMSRPLGYFSFLCLFNGTLMLDVDEEQLERLVAAQETAAVFTQTMWERYRKEDRVE